jgi:hypothetical protein
MGGSRDPRTTRPRRARPRPSVRKANLLSLSRVLTDRDRRMLEDLFEHRVLTVHQIAEMYFASGPVTRRRMIRLVRVARGEDPALRRTNGSDYLLTGLVVCEKCGKRFIGAAAKGNAYRYPYYVCFSRHRYGTQECDQDRLRAEELEERVVQSLLATFERGDLLEQALTEWTEITEKARPRRERELSATEARIKKTQDALDRYFLAFEEGKLREELCTARIEELSGKLASLEARRADLVGEISGSPPEALTPGDLGQLRQEVQRSLTDGPLPERKAAMQSVVAEIKVRDRGHIKPVFRVPVFRPPYGLVLPVGLELV